MTRVFSPAALVRARAFYFTVMTNCWPMCDFLYWLAAGKGDMIAKNVGDQLDDKAPPLFSCCAGDIPPRHPLFLCAPTDLT
jgi:hypothetical protein